MPGGVKKVFNLVPGYHWVKTAAFRHSHYDRDVVLNLLSNLLIVKCLSIAILR